MDKKKYFVFSLLMLFVLSCLSLNGCRSEKKDAETNQEGLTIETNNEQKEESKEFDELFGNDDEEDSDKDKTDSVNNNSNNNSSNSNTNNSSAQKDTISNSKPNQGTKDDSNEEIVTDPKEENEELDKVISEDTGKWGPLH